MLARARPCWKGGQHRPRVLGSRGPSNNRGAGDSERPGARRQADCADQQLQRKPPKASRGREQRSEHPSPEPGVRVPALRGLVEPAPEARGTCRPESLEWRARDVSAPCLARHLTPSPPTACALARLQSSEQAPPSAAASASLGGRTDPGCGDSAAEAPERTPPPPPPRDDGGKATPARTEAVIAHPLSAPLVPAGARTKHACAGRAGARATASASGARCTPPFCRSSRRSSSALGD
uniref:putative HTLV-1-related endogenous sequence n=1 Tax=Arvicanthis niloticus TaxID=61156 RepID=UPI0014867DC9|nr:putative HTLV-1-related endogenous sequence [Arvicanthis niloticus]